MPLGAWRGQGDLEPQQDAVLGWPQVLKQTPSGELEQLPVLLGLLLGVALVGQRP